MLSAGSPSDSADSTSCAAKAVLRPACARETRDQQPAPECAHLAAHGGHAASPADRRTIVTDCPPVAPTTRPTLGPTKHAERLVPPKHEEVAAAEGEGTVEKEAPSWASAANPCLAHIDLLCGDVQASVVDCGACVNGHRSELMEGGCAADSEMDLYQIVAYCATSSPTSDPTLAPTAPTASPTTRPTVEGDTNAPTMPPSEAPTGAPTYTCALALDSWCGDAKAGGGGRAADGHEGWRWRAPATASSNDCL